MVLYADHSSTLEAEAKGLLQVLGQHRLLTKHGVYASNLSFREIEVGRSEVLGHPKLHKVAQGSLGYRPYLQLNIKKKKKAVSQTVERELLNAKFPGIAHTCDLSSREPEVGMSRV